MRTAAILDRLIFPSLLLIPIIAANALLERGISTFIVTPLIGGGLAAVVALLERTRPESVDHLELDQPAQVEAGHFLFGVELPFQAASEAWRLRPQNP